MKIKDIRLTRLFSKFKTPYVWAMGKNLGQTTILVEVETDAGVVGYGETAPTMTSPEAIHSLLLTGKTVLIGQPITQIADLMKRFFTRNFGHHYASQSHPRIGNIAFAGVELALWDALGKSVGLPVHALLGGKNHDTVSFMGFVQGDSTNEVAAHAGQLAQDGFEVIYLKAGNTNAKDMANVEAVRKAIGNKRLRIDPNEAWDLMEAQVMINKLAKYDLEMVEQPVSAIAGVPALKALKQSCSVPIAADQSVFTPEEAHAMCASGAASLLTVGVHETGGILGFRRVAAIAQVFDINVCLHGVWETGDYDLRLYSGGGRGVQPRRWQSDNVATAGGRHRRKPGSDAECRKNCGYVWPWPWIFPERGRHWSGRGSLWQANRLRIDTCRCRGAIFHASLRAKGI